MATVSENEIKRWTEIIARNPAEGKDRLCRYMCSLALGRDFGEQTAAYYTRRGLTAFRDWFPTAMGI